MNFVIPQTIGDAHTLWAGLMFIHPSNGRRYYGVCSQHGGSDQDFVIYRRAVNQEEFEFVAKLDGKGLDATAFVTAGMGLIRHDGALEFCASGQPVGVTDDSGTGFDGFGKVVLGVDDPYPYLTSDTGTTPPPAPDDADVSELKQRVAYLEQQLAGALDLARKATERANYVKSVFDPVWGELEALKTRPVGISRDDAWQLAADRCYVEVTTEGTGVRSEIKSLAGAGTANIDQVARDVANAALTRAADAKQLAAQGWEGVTAVNQRAAAIENNAITLWGRVDLVEKSRPSIDEVAQLIRSHLEEQWQAWVTYADRRLLNLIWDRTVKLLRYKESSGKTAAQLPVNDPANLKV